MFFHNSDINNIQNNNIILLIKYQIVVTYCIIFLYSIFNYDNKSVYSVIYYNYESTGLTTIV